MLDILAQDYTGSQGDDDRSFVTGVLLLRDDSGMGRTAVQEFNRAILNSGIVREFIKQNHSKYQTSPSGQSKSLSDHKREYLKCTVEKKGVHAFSKLPGA